MRQQTINILTVNELSDQAKQKAHRAYLHAGIYNDSESDNTASLDAFASIFPIKIKNWEYNSCNGYIRFEMKVDYEEIENMSGVRLCKYLFNNYWEHITKGKYYGKLPNTFKDGTPIPVSKKHPNGTRYVWRYSKCMLEFSCTLTGYYMDSVLLEPLFEFMNRPDDTTFRQLLKRCLDAWISVCIKDMQYQESLECFVDMAIANNWEFFENGKRWEHERYSLPLSIPKQAA